VFSSSDGTALSEQMRITSAGNVGIGTSTPAQNLVINGSPALDGSDPIEIEMFSTRDSASYTAGAAMHRINFNSNDGSGGAGTRAKIESLVIDTTYNDSALSFYTTSAGFGGLTEQMRIDHTGNVGIGIAVPAETLHVAGTAQITTSVAVTDDRTLCTASASGKIEFVNGACGTSSLRYKQNIESLSYGLNEVLELNPVFFEYKDAASAIDRTKRRIGFIAEEVNEVIPEVVIWQGGIVESIDYAFLTSLLVKSVQELSQKFDDVWGDTLARLSDWGVTVTETFTRINNLFASTLHIENQLCVDDVCISKENLKALLVQYGGVSVNAHSSGDSDTSSPSSDSEPSPTVEEEEPAPEVSPEPAQEEPVVEETVVEEPVSEPVPEPVEELSTESTTESTVEAEETLTEP
ncbi:MAG: tail fiber domain-containing protein, partial [Parcubacteria group bacterium]